MTNEHYEKYDALARKIGIDTLKAAIPLKPETIRAALKEDEHLNTISIRKCDQWAGFTVHTNMKTQEQKFYGHFYGVWERTKNMGLSLAERVCILKHVARHYMV
jgi:hypothetical protein